VEKIHPLIGLFSLAIAFSFFPFLVSQCTQKKKKKKKKKRKEEEEGINFHSFLCNKGMDKNSRTTKPND
jgi:hypothetical protein